MEILGVVGYPNSGKTTLFNAVTGLAAPTAPHPFSTTEPNLGVAHVPDAGLEAAAAVEGSAKTVHASLELIDLPAVAAPGGSGFGAEFIGRLREVDALVCVLRAFEDVAVPSDESGLGPPNQAENLLLELALADADVFSRKLERLQKEASADPSKKREVEAVERAAAIVDGGESLRSTDWSEEERGYFRDMSPLTLKPAVWVINVGEDDDRDHAPSVTAVVPAGDTVVALSARLEEEAAQLDATERQELYEGLGMGEGALAVMVRAAYDALGVVSFYTLGPKEAHAWTVGKTATVREAAGKIHSDLERGFIRAEVVALERVIELGGWDATKAAGELRLEGKDYIVQAGDAILVRFSV